MKPFLLSGVLITMVIMSTMQLRAHEEKKSEDSKPKGEISSRTDIEVENKKERREKAKAAVKLFFQKLNEADLEGTLASAAVPFAWDKKHLLQDKEELKKFIKKVVDKNGVRKSPKITMKIIDEKNSVVNNCIPVSYYTVEVKIKKAVLYFCVRPGDEYKVVGFTD